MAEKRKSSDGKTFGRPNFRTEKLSEKKKSESFSVRKFSFLMYLCSPLSKYSSYIYVLMINICSVVYLTLLHMSLHRPYPRQTIPKRTEPDGHFPSGTVARPYVSPTGQ